MESQSQPDAMTFKDLPDFENITPQQIRPLTDALLARLREDVTKISAQQSPDVDSLVVAFEQLRHDLGRSWSPISHLNMVRNSPEWQTAYLDALADVTAFSSELAQNAQIFRGYERIAGQLPTASDSEQRKAIEHTLRDFRLAGIGLDDAGQSRYRELMQSLSASQARFSNNLQCCTDEWQWHTDIDAEVAGIPAPVLSQARNAAKANGDSGWTFGLTQPVYQAVVTQAEHRATRERFYRAWMTRATASGEHSVEYDNTALMQEILSARQELASLLGFESYAEYSLAAKMAGSVGEVTGFLRDLCDRSLPTARKEYEALAQLAGHELEAWDTSYFAERSREQTFAISDEDVRPYFPVDPALQGLFDLAGRLFSISFKPRSDIATWHEDVGFLEVRNGTDDIIGGFYIDLFARAGKRGGAWIDECVVRKSFGDSTILPVGYLVCNFSPPDADRPSLLTHNEVVTLFHEFGHMLHHILTRVGYPSIAGINGVPWDAVELPSQFMENFAWHYEVLNACSAHYQTGEKLPRELFDKLEASRNASSGIQMLRQLEFALFDFELHARKDAAAPGVVRDVLSETRELTTPITPPSWSRFENGFSHIFAGGYAAGYYSYKWAEVLAADAFSAFDEAGSIFDTSTAARFREQILEVGASRDIHDAFVAFRGREPSIDALLFNSGIIAA